MKFRLQFEKMSSSSNSSSNETITASKPPIKKIHDQSLIREGNYLQGKDEYSRKSAEVDLEEMMERSPCISLYHQLEECLAETNRDWRKCQKEVKLLKECSTNSQNK